MPGSERSSRLVNDLGDLEPPIRHIRNIPRLFDEMKETFQEEMGKSRFADHRQNFLLEKIHRQAEEAPTSIWCMGKIQQLCYWPMVIGVLIYLSIFYAESGVVALSAKIATSMSVPLICVKFFEHILLKPFKKIVGWVNKIVNNGEPEIKREIDALRN